MADQVVEGHPRLHDWYIKGDVVVERHKGRMPKTIHRFSGCEYCPTILTEVIDVRTWQSTKRYKYVVGVKIIRMTTEEWRKAQFIKTTDLDEKTVNRLRRGK